jgi:Uma2 family endonuclease
VDERLVMPETRHEVINGKVVYVSPADEPHGTLHSRMAALLQAHVVADYQCAVDMLTRTSARNDFAPDASVFPVARDPETGGRKLEELAFEVVSTESLARAGRKAQKLVERGVRRVFAIDVERKRAMEWSTRTNAWEILATGGVIEDGTLIVPLPIQALVEAFDADNAVARALLAKKNDVLEGALRSAREAGKIEGKTDGKLEGKIEALLQILAARGIRVPKKGTKMILEERNEAVVDQWLGCAASCATVDDLFQK